jgi:hypothetical protein
MAYRHQHFSGRYKRGILHVCVSIVGGTFAGFEILGWSTGQLKKDTKGMALVTIPHNQSLLEARLE